MRPTGRRNTGRYIKTAKLIIENVGKGVFPSLAKQPVAGQPDQ
jgi:hypothetical protein